MIRQVETSPRPTEKPICDRAARLVRVSLRWVRLALRRASGVRLSCVRATVTLPLGRIEQIERTVDVSEVVGREPLTEDPVGPCLVEQDHRNIKRRIRQMLGFKSFRRAQTLLAGIELLHMIRKGQYQHPAGDEMSPAEQFYLLVA